MNHSALLDSLCQITGPAHILSTGDLSAYEQDWRKRSRGKALAVARPSNTGEVAAIVKACATAGVSIVTQGGNTGLVVGGIPDDSGQQLVLSLQRMNAVRHIDSENMTITAEAGCILQNLQEAAENAGFLFPLSLAAQGSCTIGGNLATNAGGTQVVRYGNARDLCLGLEVVTAAGDIWDGLTGLRKDNTGYDLRDLFIGSEGTLGIITACTLKLFPQPVARLTAWAAVPSMQHAVALLGLAHQHLGPGLTGFEVMGQFALSLVAKNFKQLRVPFLETPAAAPGMSTQGTTRSGSSQAHFEESVDASFCVLLENSDQESESHAREQFERLLETALEQGCVTNAVVAENIAQANQLWHIRESIPLAQAEEGLNIKHDISVAVSRIPEFVAATDALLLASVPGIRLVNFGHLGDGNLHYNVQAPSGADGAAFLRDHEEQVNALVYDSVMQFGGSISAEHGVGSLKLDKLEQHKSPVAMGMMRAIKQALDPHNLMNPGRVIRI